MGVSYPPYTVVALPAIRGDSVRISRTSRATGRSQTRTGTELIDSCVFLGAKVATVALEETDANIRVEHPVVDSTHRVTVSPEIGQRWADRTA